MWLVHWEHGYTQRHTSYGQYQATEKFWDFERDIPNTSQHTKSIAAECEDEVLSQTPLFHSPVVNQVYLPSHAVHNSQANHTHYAGTRHATINSTVTMGDGFQQIYKVPFSCACVTNFHGYTSFLIDHA